MKTITTLLLVLCISFCNAQFSTFYTTDSLSKPHFKITYQVPLSSYEVDLVAHPLGYIIGCLPNTEPLFIDSSALPIWGGRHSFMPFVQPVDSVLVAFSGVVTGDMTIHYEYIDSVKAIDDKTIAYYYNPRIWKDRYYALKKMRDYGYFRIPIHNRHKFKKAEKEYRELMK